MPIGVDRLNLHYFESAPRREPPVVPVSARLPDAEIEGSLADSAVRAEAARCLSCGNCLACDNCWNFCPNSSVLKTPEPVADGSRYVFDYDFCKGCGLCARECPTGFIAMVEETVPAGGAPG